VTPHEFEHLSTRAPSANASSSPGKSPLAAQRHIASSAGDKSTTVLAPIHIRPVSYLFSLAISHGPREIFAHARGHITKPDDFSFEFANGICLARAANPPFPTD
jgi:hypothetical protein